MAASRTEASRKRYQVCRVAAKVNGVNLQSRGVSLSDAAIALASESRGGVYGPQAVQMLGAVHRARMYH